jgi:hypothetical protein
MRHLRRRLETMAARPACIKGVQVPSPSDDGQDMQKWIEKFRAGQA